MTLESRQIGAIKTGNQLARYWHGCSARNLARDLFLGGVSRSDIGKIVANEFGTNGFPDTPSIKRLAATTLLRGNETDRIPPTFSQELYEEISRMNKRDLISKARKSEARERDLQAPLENIIVKYFSWANPNNNPWGYMEIFNLYLERNFGELASAKIAERLNHRFHSDEKVRDKNSVNACVKRYELRD